MSNTFYNKKAEQAIEFYYKEIFSYFNNPQFSNSINYVSRSQSTNLEMCYFNFDYKTVPVYVATTNAIRAEFTQKLNNINGIIIWAEDGAFTYGNHEHLSKSCIRIQDKTIKERDITCTIKKTGKKYTRHINGEVRHYKVYEPENIPGVEYHKITKGTDSYCYIDEKFIDLLQGKELTRLQDGIDIIKKNHILWNRVQTNNVYFGIISQDQTLCHVTSPYKLARELAHKYTDCYLKNYKIKSLYNIIYNRYKSGDLGTIELKFYNKQDNILTHTELLVVSHEYLSCMPNITHKRNTRGKGKKPAMSAAERQRLCRLRKKANACIDVANQNNTKTNTVTLRGAGELSPRIYVTK